MEEPLWAPRRLKSACLCLLWSWFVPLSVYSWISFDASLGIDLIFYSTDLHPQQVTSEFKECLWTSRKKYITAAALPVLSVLAWGKGELSPCRRLLAADKRFCVFLPAFVFAALYLGITPGSWSITPLQSGSPQWVACSPFRAVTQERQCSTPVGSTEGFLCFIVSSARWDRGVSCCSLTSHGKDYRRSLWRTCCTPVHVFDAIMQNESPPAAAEERFKKQIWYSVRTDSGLHDVVMWFEAIGSALVLFEPWVWPFTLETLNTNTHYSGI